MKGIVRSIVFIAVMLLQSSNLYAGDLEAYKKGGHKSPKWTPLVEAGFSAFDSNDTEAAVNFFQRAMEKGCKDGLIYFKTGLYYESLENFTKALDYLKKAGEYLPKQYPSNEATKTIHEHLGRILFATGHLNEARTELIGAIQTQGDSFTPLFLLGSIARLQNKDEEMIGYYSSALMLPAPEGTNPHEIALTLLIEIGKAYDRLGQPERSLEVWNKILELTPGHPIALEYKKNLEKKRTGSYLKDEERRILEQIIK